MKLLKIGVVGYCPPTKFDAEEARKMIVDAYDKLEKMYPGYFFTVASGLTNVGVLKIAYNEAKKRGWSTAGIACQKALSYELFPVDLKIIAGRNWGDESSIFLSFVDAIVRIGSGKQSMAETEEAKKMGLIALEYDLPVLKN
jgi:hypothetical protein